MTRSTIVRYLAPWIRKREQAQLRIDELRRRDGDRCTRCRREMRFDLPSGHDLSPTVETILTRSGGDAQAIDNLCLTHGRCNLQGQDHTAEVLERLRPAREAELFAKSRKKRAA